jgi:exonuclease III
VICQLLLIMEELTKTDSVLKCMSYNCRGFNDVKKSYVFKLLKQCDVLFLQEHWLSDAQLDGLATISSTHLAMGISGFGCSDVLSGRPYGGCAIFWRRNLLFQVVPVLTDSRRMCCLMLSCSEFKLLFINVYMPNEVDLANLDEFSLQLAIVDDVINRNPDAHIILGGDFNVDFSRDWSHTILLNDFCLNICINPVIRHPCNTVDFTYNFNMKTFSAIDHFILSEQLFCKAVKCVSVLHDVDNISDHDPLYIELELTVARCMFEASRKRESKPSYQHHINHQHIAAYKHSLSCNLHDIVLPFEALLCRDISCDNSHIIGLNAFVCDISNACLSAGMTSLPLTRPGGSRGHIPGWTVYVAPHRDKAIMWHKVWAESGRPRNGTVADIMHKTRAAYHYAIRRVRRECR